MNYATIKKCDVANRTRCTCVAICEPDAHIIAQDALIKKHGIIIMVMHLPKKKKMK